MMTFFKKPTLFLFLGLIIFVGSILYSFYEMTLPLGNQSMGMVLIPAIGISFIVVLIDRALVQKIRPLLLSGFELITGIVVILYFSFQYRELIVDISDNTSNYFVLIHSNQETNQPILEYKFPFDRKIKISQNSLVINQDLRKKYHVQINAPKAWEEQGYGAFSVIRKDGSGTQFWSGPKIFTEHQRDSLINLALSAL